MKKIIKGIAILFAVIGLAGCAGTPKDSGSKDVIVNGLTVNGIELGGDWNSNAIVSGNTIIFKNLNNNGCGTGWTLCGVDLSEYTKVRITFEMSGCKTCFSIIRTRF